MDSDVQHASSKTPPHRLRAFLCALFYQFVLRFSPFLSLGATHQTLHWEALAVFWSVTYSMSSQGKELRAQRSRDDAEKKLPSGETEAGKHRSIYFDQERGDLPS